MRLPTPGGKKRAAAYGAAPAETADPPSPRESSDVSGPALTASADPAAVVRSAGAAAVGSPADLAAVGASTEGDGDLVAGELVSEESDDDPGTAWAAGVDEAHVPGDASDLDGLADTHAVDLAGDLDDDDTAVDPGDTGAAGGPAGAGDLDETNGGSPGARPGSPVVYPQITVRWPEAPARALAECVTRDGRLGETTLAVELPALWPLVAQVAGRFGCGALTRDSIRWDDHWQLAPVPLVDQYGQVRDAGVDYVEPRARQGLWLQDRYAVACALLRAATGRWPVGPADALALTSCLDPHAVPGLDAVVHLLLSGEIDPGDVRPLEELSGELGRRPVVRVAIRCFKETMVGSAKARGGVGDNEDQAYWTITQDGSAQLALLDGATGDGDGSGRRAAVVAVNELREQWRGGCFDPARLLRLADDAVTEHAGGGAAVAVIARLEPAGSGELISVGDAACWQLRRATAGGYLAWRLAAVHTEHTRRLLRASNAEGGQSQVTRVLGGGADEPFGTRLNLLPGDLVVLASDGAAIPDPGGEWFGTTLARLALARATSNRPLGPGLAADLVVRAEQFGGHDNATALVAEIRPAAPATARP